MKGLASIFAFLMISISIVVLAQNTDSTTNKRKWTPWEESSFADEEGRKIVCKERSRLMRRQHGVVQEKLIFEYDLCGNLIRKTKYRVDMKCFNGIGRVVSEKCYKSSCSLEPIKSTRIRAL